MEDSDRRLLERVADYQFGSGAGAALFGGDDLTISHTSSGRPRQVLADGERLVTYTSDGRHTVGEAGGRRLRDRFDPPRHRVVVGSESEPYVRDGRNVFAKFVRRADDGIRPGDEVLVVHRDDDALIAVGRAVLSGAGMADFETGMAVKVREGVEADAEN